MIVRLVGVVLVVREIGPAPFGIYSAAAAFVLFVATFAQLGLEVYLIRLPGELRARHYNQAFTLLLV
ncbi:MAG: oligosaccharide flippase family protein, partial [Acidimicrobiales bacterium]